MWRQRLCCFLGETFPACFPEKQVFGYITFPVPRSLTKGFLLLALFLFHVGIVHSWKMGWALDRFSGFLIAPSPSASTSQISFYASKKPIGQKCCMSCLDQFTEFVYLRYRLILNQFATDTKIRSPQAPVSDPMAD